MTDPNRITPLTTAMYSALYHDPELAAVAGHAIADRWLQPIAVVPCGEMWALFDLSTDPSGRLEHTAVHIAEPAPAIADVDVRAGLL